MTRVAIVLATVLASAAVAQDPRDNVVTLDVYRFSQDDDDGAGQPFRAEGFDYSGVRGGMKLKLDDRTDFRFVVVPAFIENDDALDLPPTIGNGSTASASGDLATVDALVAVDYELDPNGWTVSPGLYYHMQLDYIGIGFDLGAARDLRAGRSRFKANYSFRHDFLELNYWDRSYRGSDVRVSNNLLLSWTEVLSESWKGNASLQISRQDGLLSDQHNYVTVFDGAGVPNLLVDEVLPNHRNRMQLNARMRYSPIVGHSVGVDGSYYRDDWDVELFAVEPSLDVSLGGGVRLRTWWRFSDQRRSEYFTSQPTAPGRFRTQDSDLGDFTMHSPGTTLTLPLRDGSPTWEASVSIYGFERSDGIDGLGGKLQFSASW